jgi:hypothetical protein
MITGKLEIALLCDDATHPSTYIVADLDTSRYVLVDLTLGYDILAERTLIRCRLT